VSILSTVFPSALVARKSTNAHDCVPDRNQELRRHEHCQFLMQAPTNVEVTTFMLNGMFHSFKLYNQVTYLTLCAIGDNELPVNFHDSRPFALPNH
jgi:hypothetical protein